MVVIERSGVASAVGERFDHLEVVERTRPPAQRKKRETRTIIRLKLRIFGLTPGASYYFRLLKRKSGAYGREC